MCSRPQPAQRGREFPNMSDGINEEYTPLTNHPAFFLFFIAKSSESSEFLKVKKNTTSHQPGSPSPKKKIITVGGVLG